MGFAIGETVGPYKITSYLGQGGMATIYRAKQLTLDRDVALKVIHPALKDDQSFIMRFKREASIVAKLNHPNIVPVYDFGEFEGVSYIVMRFIEGQTLKDVLSDKRLGTKQILDILRPVADALGYAHSRGVLHRDVKPSNVLIDTEGNVYLADFGLARLGHSGESTLSQEMIIGSPQYISPEQGRGEQADDRSDIYSLGVVVYEMFTGRVPFAGDTPYTMILGHINDPLPPPRQFNSKINPAIEQVIAKALAKDKEKRFRTVRELMRALDNAARGPIDDNEPAAPIVIAPSKPAVANPITEIIARVRNGFENRQPFALAVAGIAVLCLLLVCLMVAASSLGNRLPFLAGILPGQNAATRTIARPPTTPTPSGPPNPTSAGSIQPTATLVAIIPGTNPPSPTRPALARGRIAYTIATDPAAEQHAVWVANADGTSPHLVAEFSMWPALAPDGLQIAYYKMKSDNGIFIANLDGGNAHRVISGSDVCCVQWSPDGKRLVYFKGNLKQTGMILIAALDGSLIQEVGPGFNPSWARDSSRLAYAGCAPNSTQCGIFVYDLRTRTAHQITRDNGGNPQWSPTSDRIVYRADDGKGHTNVFVMDSEGTDRKQLTNGTSNDGQPDWSRDGNMIYWRTDQSGAGWAIAVMNADGSNQRVIIRNAPPDGDLWGRESLSGGP